MPGSPPISLLNISVYRLQPRLFIDSLPYLKIRNQKDHKELWFRIQSVLPRLLYGLDVIRLTKTDIKNLSTYCVQLLKQIQHLPVRTSTAAVLILAGQIPIEAELHKRMLSLFRNIAENKGSIWNIILLSDNLQ
jgi:hypothetical protein